MSLAQRRTTLDGIETISLPHREDAGSAEEARTLVNDTTNQHPTKVNDDDNNNDREGEVSGRGSETATIVAVPAEDGKDIWKTISYDPFSATTAKEDVLPELQHYESFPAELGDNVMAYEVSTAKRVGEYWLGEEIQDGSRSDPSTC